MSTRDVELFRDGPTTPWGFRLVGGKDLKQALHIQKVSLCSPSHGELEAGDVLLKVQGYDATELSHASAQDIIRRAGGSLKMTIKRCGLSQSSSQPQQFRPQSWHQGQGSYMMHRLQNTLNGAVSNKHPLAVNRARLTLADWLLHNDLPAASSPAKEPVEFGWTARKQPAQSRNEMGTCFIPAHFSSKASVDLSPLPHINQHHNPFLAHSPHTSEPPHHQQYRNNAVSSPAPSYASVEPSHQTNGSHLPSNKQYNSPFALYASFKPLPRHLSKSPSCQSTEKNEDLQEEVLYTHKVHQD